MKYEGIPEDVKDVNDNIAQTLDLPTHRALAWLSTSTTRLKLFYSCACFQVQITLRFNLLTRHEVITCFHHSHVKHSNDF